MDISASDDGKKSNSSSSDLCISTTTIIGSSLIDQNQHNDSRSNAEEKNNQHILEAVQQKQGEYSIEGKNSSLLPQLLKLLHMIQTVFISLNIGLSYI